MKYIIVQDSRLNIGMNIVLIDKDKKSINGKWWTSVLKDAKQFDTKEEANIVCEKYKFNNPRVIPYDEAKDIIIPIITETYSIVKKIRRRSIFDMDMWEYKEWLGYSDANECGGGMFT